MRFFKRGEIADSRFIFIDSITGEPKDVDNPQYTICYFQGPVENTVVPWTELTKLPNKVGEYICNWEIPGDVPENQTYFVTAKGIHPTDGTTTVTEDFYRVLPSGFFGGSGGSSGGNGGMTMKFTKP